MVQRTASQRHGRRCQAHLGFPPFRAAYGEATSCFTDIEGSFHLTRLLRQVQDQATSMKGSGEILVIERHGEPIGFYVPIAAKDRKAGRKALTGWARRSRSSRTWAAC